MIMEYPLVQYQCNKCGKLTKVMDCDERLPQGWIIRDSNEHFCPICSKKLKEEKTLAKIEQI